MKKFNFILSTLVMLCVFTANLWAEKITDPNQIISGQTYYIGATTGGTDYYLSVDGSALSTAAKGTAVTDKTAAAKFVVTMNEGWVFAFADSPYYLGLISSKSNGNVNVSADAKAFSATTTDKGLLRLTMNGYAVQKNTSTTNFGSYASNQTDVWLEMVEQGTTQPTDSTWTQPTDTTGTTSGTTTGGTTTQPTDTTGTTTGGTTTGSSTTEYLFYESFDGNKGNGGNDGQWSGISSGPTIQTDETGWVAVKGYGANACVRFGTSSAQGSMQTPDITITAPAILTFRAGAWLNDATTLDVAFSNGTTQTITMPSGAFGDFEIPLTATGTFNITFSGASSKGRFFLDEVAINAPGTLLVEAPSLPESTYFTGNMTVRIPMQDSTTVYYTLDGSDPTPNSSVYTGPFYLYNTTTVKAIAMKNGVTSRVAEATYTFVPSYASLEALVADTMLQSGAMVDVSFRNVVIDSIVVTGSGYRNGIFVEVNNKMIEFYCKNVPTDWVAGGTIEGQLQCPWKLYNGIWELCPTSWDGIAYTAPQTSNPDTNPTDTTGTTTGGTEGWYKVTVDRTVFPWDPYELYFWAATTDSTSQVTEGTPSNEYYTYYVRPGSTMLLGWGVTSQASPLVETGFILNSNDSLYTNLELSVSTDSYFIECTPTGDIAFVPAPKQTNPTDTTTTSGGRPAGTEGWNMIYIAKTKELAERGVYFVVRPDSDSTVVEASTDEAYIWYVLPHAYIWMTAACNNVTDNLSLNFFNEDGSPNNDIFLPIGSTSYFTPITDMKLTATLTDPNGTSDGRPAGTEGWYKIVIENQLSADGIIFWMSDAYDFSTWTQPDTGNVVVPRDQNSSEDNSRYVAYVRPGAGAAFAWMNFSQKYQGGDTIAVSSTDSRYDNMLLTLPGAYSSESAIMNIFPEGDITFKAHEMEHQPTDTTGTTDNGPVCPEGWYTVTIPASKYVGFGCEEAYNPDNEWGYGEGLQRYDQEDGGMTLFVRPGTEFWLYINQKYDAAGEPLYEFSYDHFVTFASSDTTYNGKQEHFGNTLFVHPTGNMTLSVANVEYGYYHIYLSSENNENVSYEPVYGELTNQEPDFEMVESADTVYIKVRKGKAFKLQAKITNEAHHFVSWAGNSRLEAITSPLLEYTPTDDDKYLWIYARTSAYNHQTLTLTREDFFTYYSTDYNWYDDTSDEESEDGLIRTITVREGDTIRVEVGIEDFVKGFAYWQSNDSAYNGLTTPELTVVMNKSLTLTPVFENLYWMITLPVRDNLEFLVELTSDQPELEEGFALLEGERTGSKQIFYVRKGYSMDITPYYLDAMGNYDYHYLITLNANDSTIGDATVLSGRATTYTPHSDLYFSASAEFAYWKITLDEVYNVVGIRELSQTLRIPGDTLDQLWVLKGESFQVECEIYDEELKLDRWSTGDTAQVLTYTPIANMTLSAILTDRYTYNKVILVTPDSETRVFVDSYYSGIFREGESTAQNEQVYLVREGELLAFYAESSSRIKEFSHWNIEYLTADGSRTTDTNTYLNTAVNADAYITRVTPVYENAYYAVRLLGADTLSIVVEEDYSSVTSSHRNYFVEYETIDTISGLQVPVYYIHKGDSLNFTYEQPWNHPEYVFDHWTSSVQAYNGSTADPLCVKPASDMTLGVACTVGYWRIYIPETEGRIVDIFDAEEYDNPQVAPEPRTAARAYGITDRNVFMTREERDSVETWFFYAKKDARVVAVAVEMLNNPLYHLDHWVSDNDSVNRRTENPVYFTPSSDMHIDFVTAKNVLVVGNDTIALPDTISSDANAKVTIEITEDKSIVLEIEKDAEGQTTTTMVFDSAQIANAGITSDIATLILEVENTNNIILPDTIDDQIGFHFTGDELIITSNTYDESVSIDLRDTTAMLVIRAAQGLVGNGSNNLTIDGRLIVSSFGPTTLMAAPVRHVPGLTVMPGTPAISGFEMVTVSDRVALQEVWYADGNGGQQKSENPERCQYDAAQQSFGEVDMDASSFTPATTLVFSDGSFYTDYLDGTIDVNVTTGLFNPIKPVANDDVDHGYYDILGRSLNGPQQGIYIHEGRVFLQP